MHGCQTYVLWYMIITSSPGTGIQEVSFFFVSEHLFCCGDKRSNSIGHWCQREDHIAKLQLKKVCAS